MTDTTGLAKTARATAETLLQRIAKEKVQATRAFYDIGGALQKLLDEKLYGALGFASFEELLVARDVMDVSQAKKLIEVHRKFSREKALAVGAEKAYAIARYAARTKAKDDPEAIVEKGFPIGGRRRPVGEVSVRAVLEATRTAVARQSGNRGDDERARRDAEGELRFVREVLHEHALDTDASLHFRRGSWHVRFEVPAHRVRAILRREK